MEELKNEGKKFLRKMQKYISDRNLKASYFMTETLIVQKVAYIHASLYEGEWFRSVSIFSSEKKSATKNRKSSEFFFHF